MSRLFPVVFGTLLILSGCTGEETESSVAAHFETYEVRGVLESATDDSTYLTIHHEPIPGYMDAMTMPFVVADTARVPAIAAGDTITFRLASTEQGDRIYDLKVVVR